MVVRMTWLRRVRCRIVSAEVAVNGIILVARWSVR
jgi:hypothetical protein